MINTHIKYKIEILKNKRRLKNKTKGGDNSQ